MRLSVQTVNERHRRHMVTSLVIVAIAMTGFVAVPGMVVGQQKRVAATPSFQVKGGETRPVLDPALFTGRTRAAYQAAKEIPHILDKLFCYCFCHNVPFEHTSLLSCFVTKHGAG